MVRDEYELPAQEVILQLVEGPFDSQGLLLHGGIIFLVGEELPANVDYRVLFSPPDLGENRSQSHLGCVCVDY